MPTIGEIARRLDVPPHRIEYAIRAHGIEPEGWAGNARVFSEEAVRSIGTILRAEDGHRLENEGVNRG